MSRRVILDTLGWGVTLWFIGYLLGIILFFFVPPSLLGWFIMPIGIVITLWVLLKRIHSSSLKYYIFIGMVWAIFAIILDYLLLVKIFKPTDGYYKLDVYVYYLSTFILPPLVGWIKTVKRSHYQV